MNILISCHDYKQHKPLTLVLGPEKKDYILLDESNIKNIFRITGGKISSIKFIDTHESTLNDNIQYKSWSQLLPNSFDLIYTINCRPNIKEEDYKRVLKPGGKLINVGIEHFWVETETKTVPHPVISLPNSETHNQTFGHRNSFVTYSDRPREKIYVDINTTFLPQMNDCGIVDVSKMKNFNNVGGYRKRNFFRKTRKNTRRKLSRTKRYRFI
jgi:hypothetical protein